MNPDCFGIVWTGSSLLDVRNPDPAAITVDDIAWNLARTARYGGATRRDLPPYSVLAHSLFCERLAESRDLAPWIRLQALLHDAPEYVLGDMVAPIKALLPDFSVLEANVWRAVSIRFRVAPVLAPEVHEIDAAAFLAERAALIPANAWRDDRPIPADALALATPGWFRVFGTADVPRLVAFFLQRLAEVQALTTEKGRGPRLA